MKIKNFKEKDIRKAILIKINPEIKNKRAKHWIGYIYIGGTLVTWVKIPNESKKNMYQNKTKRIAKSLRLENHHFNLLVECPLRGPEYYKMLEECK